MISWKYSFKRLNEEYEIAKKKKQALDNLFETGRISQSTRDSFNSEIVSAIAEIEKQQHDLLAKMQLKTQELGSQIKTLETLLANYEIQHVVGEIDEEVYQREVSLLAAGLDMAKHELDVIKEAADQLCTPAPATVTEPSPPQESDAIPAVKDQPAETVPAVSAEVETVAETIPEEPVITVEEAVSEQPSTEIAENTSIETPTPVEDTAKVVDDKPQIVDETPQATEETSSEPVITIEASAPEPEQPSVENAEAVVMETPQPVEETPQETPQEAHPQKAPSEAHPEIIIESISEQTQSAEEASAAEETATESTENKEEA